MSEHQISPRTLVQGAHRFHLRAASLMIFLTYWLMVLTYPNFFVFNPMAETHFIRTVALWLSLLGWLIASIGTPTMLWLVSDGKYQALKWIPPVACWWPASIVFSQITSYMITGHSYLNYLIEYPVFIVTDIAIPIFALWKYAEMKRFINETNHRL